MASSYELKVENLLKGKVHYKKEVTLENLYGAKTTPLRFDFGIYNGSGQLTHLIEVDGEYHFLPIRGKLALQRQKAYDIRKDTYCLVHGIVLIRIPYWCINNLTYMDIFHTPEFVVKHKNHNHMLTPPN